MSEKLPSGVVSIRGKQYETVALRVQKFKASHADHRLITEVLHRDEQCVVMRAAIVSPTGDVLATGHAEEYRKASEINKTSALENCETSAIGRALAAFGLGGTEFASADEVARAVSGAKGSVISPVKASLAELSDESMAHVQNVADAIIEAVSLGNDVTVFELSESLDSDQRVYLFDLWKDDSKLRARVKSIVAAMRAVAAQADPAKVAA